MTDQTGVCAGSRLLVAELDCCSSDRVRLGGRVVAVCAQRLLLADASGTRELRLEALTSVVPRAGDIVSLVAGRRGDAFHIQALEVLTPHRGADPFPSPAGEYHRLNSPLRGMPQQVQRASLLRHRAACLAAIRSFFDRRGYIEVQTPHRVRLPGLEPHLVPEAAGDGYLITSPEYHMKRLLAGGLERIYFMGPCWRGDEQGPHHLGEFTMLEWYRAFSSLDALMDETEALVRQTALSVSGSTSLAYQGQRLELGAAFDRVTFAAACQHHAGVDVAGVTETPVLRKRAEAAGLGPFGSNDGFEAVASRILVERVEPALARASRPVFVHDFPAPLGALARLRADDKTVAERFELYAGGLELANAFGELTDAAEQRRRLEEDRKARRAMGAPAFDVDERFIAALAEGIPPSAGIALGVDRLLMLLVDAPDIRHVVAFPPDAV